MSVVALCHKQCVYWLFPVSLCEHACVGQRSKSGVFLYHFPHYLLRQGLSRWIQSLPFCYTGWSVSLKNPTCFCHIITPPPPQRWGYRHMLLHTTCYMCDGAKHRSSCLCGRRFPSRAICPSELKLSTGHSLEWAGQALTEKLIRSEWLWGVSIGNYLDF